MQKIRYSPDVDALLIKVSNEPILYAEDDGQLILHYSENEKLVLIEILDVQKFVVQENIHSLTLRFFKWIRSHDRTTAVQPQILNPCDLLIISQFHATS